MVAIAAPLIPLGITGARVAGPYIANLARQYGPMAMKGLINLMSKKDDDEKITTIDQEGNVLPDLPDQMPEPDDKDPKKKTTIRPLSPEEIARKLAGEGLGQVIDKGVEKLKGKYKDLDKQKQFELEQADPVNLEKRKSPDLTDEQRETAAKNVQLQVDKKRERYQQYIPIIIKIFNENPDLKLVSRNPDEETLTTLIQKEIGPVTKAGGQITKDTIASILESSGLREKKLGSVPLETKEKIVNYLLQDDNYKTMSSKQIVKNLNLDIGHSTVSELRRKGFPGVSIEGYENQKLVPDSKSRTALAKARSLFDAMIKSDYPDISREEQNKLRVTFSDYISDAFDTGKKEGFTKKQIAEAYSYVTQERMFPTLEEQFYQDFFAQLRAENEKTFDVINQIREFEGKEPLGGFKQFMKEYPDLFLTMGHTGREDPKQGKVGGFDLRNVEYQTLADNKYANERYKELKSAWGNDETPDNIELFLEIAYDLVARDIRQVFEIPKSGETIIIGRQEPKPFPSEDEFFRFGDKKEIDFKKDGGIVGISHLIRSL